MSGTGKRAKEGRLDPFAIQGDVLGSASRGASVITAARDCSLLAVYSLVQSIGQRSPVGECPTVGSIGGTVSATAAVPGCGLLRRARMWVLQLSAKVLLHKACRG